MGEYERRAMLLGMIQSLRKSGSWCGETHIQKSAFALHELFGLFQDTKFTLYKYGPYSFDLSSDLSAMLADDYLQLKTQNDYGPRFEEDHSASFLANKFSKELASQQAKFEFVSEHFGKLKVKQLEPLATALMFSVNNEVDPESIADKVIEAKPHVDRELAMWAATKILEIKKESQSVAG